MLTAIPQSIPVASAPTEWNALYDRFIAHLRQVGVGTAAPRLHDRIDPFTLPNSMGVHVGLERFLGSGPVVMNFMRGGWCPHCRAELRAWEAAIPRLEAVGGRLLAISGEVGGLAETTRCELAPSAEMLCDVDHGLAASLGLTFPVTAELHRRYLEAGLNLADIYGDSGRILPLPATYVIDRDGVVRYAFVELDFRIRADPAVVIAVVEALG